MTRLVDTFHIHFATRCTFHKMTGAGVKSTRAQFSCALSSNCRTCVKDALFGARRAFMYRDCQRLAVERAEDVCGQVAAC